MWALTTRPIVNVEALQMLAEWKTRNQLHSDRWVLPRNLSLFGTKARPGPQTNLKLPASWLNDGTPLSAVPFPSLPHHFRSQILAAVPPPLDLERLPIIVEAKHGCEGQARLSLSPDSLRWRECTLGELFDAAMPDSDAPYYQDKLFCAASLAPRPLPSAETVTVLNAQETANPFAVDPELAHLGAPGSEPLPPELFSSLTTIACQFHYRCFQWCEVLPAGPNAPGVAAALEAGARPHLVSTKGPILLAHLSQLPLAEQRALMALVPRYALFKAGASPFVLYGGRWLPAFRLDLERRLRHQDIPSMPVQNASVQPLLWVAVAEEDLPGLTGDPLRMSLFTRRSFFNLEQLANTAVETPDIIRIS